MENLDLMKLKVGAKIYSTTTGYITITNMGYSPEFPIHSTNDEGIIDIYTKDGKRYNSNYGECIIFPSKECRDWNLYDFETGTIRDTSKESNIKQVVFKGDRKRGKDIIKYLEELGGYNKYNLSASNPNIYYVIGKDDIINCIDDLFYHFIEDSHKLLTLSHKL